MASPTRITEFRRKRKLSKQGRKRKAAVRAKGTTKSKSALFGE
ncbi:MAG: hypothetical protein AB7N80_13695 [Bdellovibrionales bacterium]